MKAWVLRLAAWVAKALPNGLRQSIYRSGPLAGAVRSTLNAAAAEGAIEVEIAAGPLAGARMNLDLKSEKTLWLGNYEPQLMQAIEQFGGPGMRAYDVGANIGYVSLALARRAGERGSVVAFEPLPANLVRLRHNLDLNAEGVRVVMVGAAVADHSAQAEFLTHRSGGMGKLVAAAGRDAEYQGSLSVEQIALDDWHAGQGGPAPDLVKIDVEGGEALVLRGMSNLIREARPLLLIELHGPQAAAEALAVLSRAGYRLLQLRKGYPPFEPGTEWKNYVVGVPGE